MAVIGCHKHRHLKQSDCHGKTCPIFLRSNAIKTLLGEGYTSPILGNEQIEIEAEGDKRGQSRFNAVPLEIVGAYWLWQSYRGNKSSLYSSAYN